MKEFSIAMQNNKELNWLGGAFYRFVVLPVLMLLGLLVAAVMLLLSPIILLAGLGAMKLWMRRVRKQARAYQTSQARYVQSYTVETVTDTANPNQAKQLTDANSETNSKS